MTADENAPQRDGPVLMPDDRAQSMPPGRWLAEPEAAVILQLYGIPFPVFEVVSTNPEAVMAAADRVGYPVVLKVVSPAIVHKTEAGAVTLGVHDPAAVPGSLGRMLETVRRRAPTARLDAILVAQEAPPGVELIVGARRDQQFGPVLAAGLGGAFVELLNEVALRLAPVSPLDAAEMIDETRVGALLAGLRGSPPLDRVAVERLLVSVSELAADRDDLLELDLNPVRVFPQGLMALDVRLRVRADGQRSPVG